MLNKILLGRLLIEIMFHLIIVLFFVFTNHFTIYQVRSPKHLFFFFFFFSVWLHRYSLFSTFKSLSLTGPFDNVWFLHLLVLFWHFKSFNFSLFLNAYLCSSSTPLVIAFPLFVFMASKVGGCKMGPQNCGWELSIGMVKGGAHFQAVWKSFGENQGFKQSFLHWVNKTWKKYLLHGILFFNLWEHNLCCGILSSF